MGVVFMFFVRRLKVVFFNKWFLNRTLFKKKAKKKDSNENYILHALVKKKTFFFKRLFVKKGKMIIVVVLFINYTMNMYNAVLSIFVDLSVPPLGSWTYSI